MEFMFQRICFEKHVSYLVNAQSRTLQGQVKDSCKTASTDKNESSVNLQL